jgi:hypothetical protein
MRRSIAWSLLAFFLIATAADGAPTSDVDIGGIVISVSDSWTAQVFHIVDQLSEWDDACHRQYGRWAARALKLDQQDRKLLWDHAALRRARGWGNGFEQAFYVDEPIDAAAQKAVETNLLRPEEAAAEKSILLHFAPKVLVLRDQGALRIASFRERLATEGEKIVPVIQKLIHFSETKETIKVPLFLVPNPEEGNGGGGFNGGRLVLEVQGRPDPLPTLFHECLHALLWQHKTAIETVAKSAGLSWGAMNEGIAYALAPGLIDTVEESDSLAEALVRNVLRGTPASDAYVQAYSVAVVIRPLLREALESGETITMFLPKAASKWRTASGRQPAVGRTSDP